MTKNVLTKTVDMMFVLPTSPKLLKDHGTFRLSSHTHHVYLSYTILCVDYLTIYIQKTSLLPSVLALFTNSYFCILP